VASQAQATALAYHKSRGALNRFKGNERKLNV